MSGADRRENVRELRRRVLDESGVGLTEPYVSTAIARLLVDLLTELEATVLELELVRLVAPGAAKHEQLGELESATRIWLFRVGLGNHWRELRRIIDAARERIS